MTLSFPPLRAIIFDVDGLLINSEDIYTSAYLAVLRAHGITTYPWSVKALQMSRGRPGTEMILRYAGLDKDLSVEAWNAQVKEHVHLFKDCKLMPGVENLLRRLQTANPPLHLAIASSSNAELFALKTAHLPAITTALPPSHRVFGSDPAMAGKAKKPAPDLFLIALERLNEQREGGATVLPAECVVFEDSIAGVQAARAAGMRVIWVPHDGLREVARGHEESVMSGTVDWKMERLEAVAGERETKDNARVVSKDGWVEMAESLEDFEAERYGLRLK